MAHVNSHAPGSFAWMELATTDQSAAEHFYGSLLGWTTTQFPMGPNSYYTMFSLEGRDSAAACTLQDSEKAMGIPPHWNLYIAVESADAAAARAAEVGGTVLAGPFDVMQHGRMAVIRDTAGAVFCIWEAKSHFGIGISGQPGAFCWADLNVPGAADPLQFYRDLFGYTTVPGDGGYLHIQNGAEMIGGAPPSASLPSHIPPHWMVYFQVADCAASTAQAQEMGAKVFMGPMEMPNVGTMSVMEDPQGAAFALFQPAAK